jgi:hypothetical protein
MRATLFLPLLALALISTAGAQDQDQSPLKCQECWSNSLREISECKGLSKPDLEKFKKLGDAQVAAIKPDDSLYSLKECLCALPARTSKILKSCAKSCPPEMADGLQSEASIVGGGVCNIPSNLEKDTAKDSSTSSGAKDEPGTAGGNSANSASNSEDKNAPSAGGASSVQWSGALLTVVAAMASAVAF